MSKLIPTLTVNTDVDTSTLSGPTTSNAHHIAASGTSGKKKRAVRKIAAKLHGLPRQLNVKGISDSGGSSADEHDLTPHNNTNQNQNIPMIYLSPAGPSSSTPRHYSLLNNNSASMPDLSTQNNSNHSNNSFGRLKKLQPRRRNLITSPTNSSHSNNNNDGYFSEDSIISPVSMVNKFKFSPSRRTITRTFSSPAKSPEISVTSSTNTSTQTIFRRKRKLSKKKKQKSFNIKPSFRNIMNFDNVAFYSPYKKFNKSNLFQSIPYDQMTSIIQHSKPPSLSPTVFDDRLSVQMNLESVQKFIDLPLIFIFKNLTETNDLENFLIFKIENFILYYHIIDDNHEDQTWCISYFKTFSGSCYDNIIVEGVNDFAEEVKENFGGERMMNQNKKDSKTFKDDVFDKFKVVEYKKLCSIDEILFKGDINLITKNAPDTNMNIFKIQAKQEIFILGTYFLDDKRKFLNTIRFFNDTKKYSEMMKYYSRGQLPIITVQTSDSESDESDEIDSEEEEIGPTDVIELIDELANSCSQYEDKIVTLRDTIVKKSKKLDSSIRNCRDLDERARKLDETISVTRSRSTKEVEETINMADQTTREIADKLTSIRTRIRDKSEILKHHQQLLTTLKDQVELEKRSSKTFDQYKMVLGVILAIFMSLAVIFMVTSGVWQQLAIIL